MNNPATSVVVPSFERPDYLQACLTALAGQRTLPDEVIVAARLNDAATAVVVREARPFPVRLVTVEQPGHIPPLAAGTEATTGAVVLFCDDDAEPWPEWLEAISRHYRDPSTGGVGGLIVQPGFEDREVATRIGRISPAGRIDRMHQHRVPHEWSARDVDALRGTNMSFRGDVIRRYPWDMRLNRGAATDYEIALCAWVRAQGYRLRYDPDAVVTHRLAPRPEIGRQASPDDIRAYSHNLVYVSATALPWWQRIVAVTASFAVGNRRSYGIATALADTVAGNPPVLRRQLVPALAGKLDGLRSALAYARSGPSSPAAHGRHTE